MWTWDQLERALAQREASELPPDGVPSPRAGGTAPGIRASADVGSHPELLRVLVAAVPAVVIVALVLVAVWT